MRKQVKKRNEHTDTLGTTISWNSATEQYEVVAWGYEGRARAEFTTVEEALAYAEEMWKF